MAPTISPPPKHARATIGFRPRRSAITPQNGATAAMTSIPVVDITPAQRIASPSSLTPRVWTYRGRNGNAIPNATIDMVCAMMSAMKVLRQPGMPSPVTAASGWVSRRSWPAGLAPLWWLGAPVP